MDNDNERREPGVSDDHSRSKIKKTLTDPVNIGLCLFFVAVFACFAVNGLKEKQKEALLTETETSVPAVSTTPKTTVRSVYTTSETTTVTTTVLAENAVDTETSFSETLTLRAASSSTSKKKTTTPVKTLVLTTAPKSSVTTVTPANTVSLADAEKEPETQVTTTTASEKETSAVTSQSKKTPMRQSFPADINKISYEGLMQVPGIGEKTAREIIEYRERNGVIYNMDLLLDIYGIGEKKLYELSSYLYVSSSDYSETTTTTTTKTETESVTEDEVIVTLPPVRRPVHINSAGVYEIADALLLPVEKAEAIVEVRNKINGFSAIEELMLVSELSGSDISNIKDYIIID